MKGVSAVLVVCILAYAPAAFGQQAIGYASVSGRVTDASGAVIAAAQVTARQTQTNVTSVIVTGPDGRFRFPYLKVGPYEIVVAHAGFRDVIQTLTLTIGAAFELPVTLAVSTIDTAVTVSGDATALEAARTQIAGTVSAVEVASVPLNGRNFLELALLVPGVSPANAASTQLFPETSAVPGASLSVGSQRNLSNNFIVDGLSANDDAAALSGIVYGVDAIEQVQVVTSGGQAELGRALGGYVNVVTKSGTNAVRGTIYDYFRDARLNARQALADRALPMRQSQYGGSLGGPLVRNRTFYFANAEQRRLTQFGLTTIRPEHVAAVNARLIETGYQGPPIARGEYPNPVHSTNGLGKLDHQISGRDQIAVRYGVYDISSRNARGAGALANRSASTDLENVDQTAAVSNTLTLGARTVLETRAQVAHSDLHAPAADPIGPAVSIAGIASFGTSSGAPTRRLNTMYQLVNNLSHQAGAHALRGGIDFLANADRITFPRAVHGSYTFSSLANFLAGLYNTAGFTQTFGVSEAAQRNPNVGLYVQDEWKLNPGVTVNVGLRYDLQFLHTIHTDTNNLSPRLGIAWVPFGSRRTVVRGSAGLFFDRVPLRAVANALLSAGNTSDPANIRQIAVSLSPGQAGAPAFPHVLAAPVPSVTLPNLTTMDPQMQNAYSRQASVEVEQQIRDRTTVSVGYQYLRGTDLIISVNQNVPTCVASGGNNGCRPQAAYGNNSQYSPRASSEYHGVHVSFMQRPARWGHYRISYTLSKAMDNVGEFFFSAPIDPFDVSRDWGRSDDDQRHRLVINAAVHSSMEPANTPWERLTHGFELSTLLQSYSALPLNITSGVTTVQGTAGRPVAGGATPTPLDARSATFIPRNAGTGPDFFSVSLRGSRTFRPAGRLQLEALAEVFNLTNRVNAVTMNGNFGTGPYPAAPSATFRQVTAAGDPRSAQIALRARF